MRIYLDNAGRLCADGTHAELVDAGVLAAAERVPQRPRGYVETWRAGRCSKVSMRASGELRVYGREPEIARSDDAFKQFLSAALSAGGIK